MSQTAGLFRLQGYVIHFLHRKNPAIMTALAERALRYDREHARSLRALAYRMLGSRTEAEDIVQEAWLRWTQVDERHRPVMLAPTSPGW